MRVRCFGFALALLSLLGLSGSKGNAAYDNDNDSVTQANVKQQQQATAEAKAAKARSRGGGGTWRLLVVLAQSQPSRSEVQRAWDEAVRELVHLDVELGWVEPPQAQSLGQPSHPTGLLASFCAQAQQGKTILLLVLGGGPAARFLLTAASSMRLPSLWMPFGQRDFVKQGREGSLESRMGSGPQEMGAAAAALMRRAHWHGFNLLVDPSLMPPSDLVGEPRPHWRGRAAEEPPGALLPRTLIYLPTDERRLSVRLRRLSEENGRGSVLVLACDLAAARRVVQQAAKYEMLAGRFLWLWLDLKAELRPSEPDAEQPAEPPAERGLMPPGMLALRAAAARTAVGPETLLSRGLGEAARALDRAMLETRSRYARFPDGQLEELFVPRCLLEAPASSEPRPKWLANEVRANVSRAITARLREHARRVSRDKAEFHLLNLQALPLPGNRTQLRWTKVGSVRAGREVRLDTIVWPGGGIVPAYAQEGRERVGMPYYKIVTALSPPFTMMVDLQEGACLRGLLCRHSAAWKCCFGYSMDLLRHVSQDLEFRFELHVARDGLFGRRRGRNGTWNGIVGELVSGRAQLAFAALSVYSHRSQLIDFTTPYYFSSVSLLIAPKERNYISLLAFLQPFSPELWIAVFTSLNITAMFVAAYEWFSPFGLNPWGRQRSKNFSIASALWVMWGLLCGHLVAFKAPKSWPNKFLINVWGGFSVIFVASYTANIAALIAGLFFHSTDNNYESRSLLLQRVAAPKASAAEFYVQQADPRLWSYMSRFSVLDVADGVERLLNSSLDVLIADTPIIDYYRATDNGCRLDKIGDTIKEDTYAVGLSKGHPLRESISKVIANYSSTGLLDILQEKWYGGLPCVHGAASGVGFDGQPHHGGQPRPLGVASVAGVFCLLGLGMIVGVLILVGEHIFYKYSLPKLRQCPKNSIWRSRNVMFFSQKLYRFINCVELVSPHHAARELVHTVRQGQITSLFQKSVKRKEHEQRRRRKSKAQFFEMIQEIRRAQQEEKVEAAAAAAEVRSGDQSRGAIRKESTLPERRSRSRSRSRSKSPMMPARGEKSRSSSNLAPGLGLEAAQLEAASGPREFTLSSSNLRARSPLELVGRRLSHGDGGSPPPTPKPRPAALTQPRRPTERGQSFPVFAAQPQASGYQVSRSPLLSPNSELTSAIGRKLSREWGSGIDLSKSAEVIFSLSPDPAVQQQQQQQQQREPREPQQQREAREPQQQREPRETREQREQRETREQREPREPQPTPTPRQRHEDGREREHRRKKSHGDAASTQQQPPIRRARSHENKDKGLGEGPAQTVSQRAKRQLESELKAILTARAHHLELHPP